MDYSSETMWIVNSMFYGMLLIGVLFLWRRTSSEHEPFLLPKLFGYTFLGAFKFTLQTVALPLGFVIAYFTAKKAGLNRTAKLNAVLLGLIFFVAGLFPVNDWVEQALYPRDDIKTYLYEDLSQPNAFDLTFSDKKSIIFRSFSKRSPENGGADAVGVKLYEELRKSKPSTAFVHSPEWNLDIIQQDKPGLDRFGKLRFSLDKDGNIAVLTYENREYVFETTPEFKRLFKDAIEKNKAGQILQNPEARTVYYTFNGIDYLNPREKRKLADNSYVSGLPDFSNIYVETVGGSVKGILNSGEYESLRQKVFEAGRNKGENKPILYWAVDPYPVNGGKEIVFTSNKATILSSESKFSIHIVNFDGSGEKVLADGMKYGNLKILDALAYLVFAEQQDDHSLLVINANTKEVKEFLIQGMPLAISKDGTYVLFQKIKEAMILPDVWVLDRITGKETNVGPPPKNFPFNKGDK